MVDVSKLSGGVKAAYIALVKCKASAALGLPAEAVKLFEEQYERKLQQARIADLELSASTDQVTTEVLAAIRAPFGQDDPKLPMAMQNLYSRIGAVRVAAFKEILAAHKWSWIPTGEGALPATEADMDGLARAAFITLVTQKLAIPCGLPADAIQAFEQKYQVQLQRARIADLENTVQSSDRVVAEVVSAIRAPFGQDDPKLPMAMQTFVDRIGAVRLSAFEEIKAAHKWSWIKPDGTETTEADMDGLARAAFITLITQKLAIPCGLPADILQSLEQKYILQLQRARIADLDKTSTASDQVAKEVLAAIRGPFGQDDAKLPMAMQTFFDRVDAVKLASYNEIEAIHNWQWKNPSWDATTPLETKIAAMDGLTRAALVALVTQKLAIPCGLAQETIQVFEQQYQSKLRLARVTDLESTQIEDPLALEVLSLVRSNFAGEKNLPRDMKTLTDKIDALKVMARKEVLSAHDWSFAECDFTCDSAMTEHPDEIFPYHVTLPKDCLLVSACYGTDGKVGQWKLRGREIHSQSPVTRIVFIKDNANFAAWHPKAYRAFVLRLVADVAKCVASDPKDRTLQEQLYRDALEDAKTCDTRSSNTPDEAWGDNDIADTMLHGGRRRPYDDPLFRD